MNERIVTISWVRNEADIIEAFVRHHVSIADQMVIIDNNSADRTGETLQALRNEGLPLDIRHSDSVRHEQGEVTTAILKELRGKADRIIPLDADEFLRTTQPLGVRAALAALPCDRISQLPWQSYVPLPDSDDAELNALKRITHRKERESPQWTKIVVPGKLIDHIDRIPMGSHGIESTASLPASHRADALALAHFPVRSAEQIAAKVLCGWLRHSANINRPHWSNFQWKALFEDCKTGRLPDADAVHHMALTYATREQYERSSFPDVAHTRAWFANATPASDNAGLLYDPLPVTFTLSYPTDRLPPIACVTETAEALAEELARMQAYGNADAA